VPDRGSRFGTNAVAFSRYTAWTFATAARTHRLRTYFPQMRLPRICAGHHGAPRIYRPNKTMQVTELKCVRENNAGRMVACVGQHVPRPLALRPGHASRPPGSSNCRLRFRISERFVLQTALDQVCGQARAGRENQDTIQPLAETDLFPAGHPPPRRRRILPPLPHVPARHDIAPARHVVPRGSRRAASAGKRAR